MTQVRLTPEEELRLERERIDAHNAALNALREYHSINDDGMGLLLILATTHRVLETLQLDHIESYAVELVKEGCPHIRLELARYAEMFFLLGRHMEREGIDLSTIPIQDA